MGFIIALLIFVCGFVLGWIACSSKVVRTRSHNEDFIRKLEKKMMNGEI